MSNKLNQTPLAETIAKGQNQDDLNPPSMHNADGVRQPREGSTLHYATLRMDTPARERVLCVFELTHAIASTLVGVQEPGVAQTKLQWWTDEIERLASNEPRHPTTKRCAQWLGGKASAHTQLTSVLDAATAARFDAPENDDDWRSVLQQDYAARLQLMHASVAPTQFQSHEPVQTETHPEAADVSDLAMAVAWMEILRTLPQRIHHDQINLPPSLYQQFEMTRTLVQTNLRVEGRQETGLDAATQDRINQWIHAGVTDALSAVDAAIATNAHLQLRSNVNTRALSSWLHLRRAQLLLWQQQKPNLLTESVTLTPLRKWFIAFKQR